VIIHRGKLVAHESVAALTARAAGATRVRSPQAERLLAALREEGLAAQALDAGRLSVDAPPERVGDLAAQLGVPLHELVAEAGTLEEAFLQLTRDEQA
jgi:ABC-2 type transport system ATP-binding protein